MNTVTVNAMMLHDGYIRLCGFSQVRDKATLCLYPDGVAVLPKPPDEIRVYHYNVEVDEERCIKDPVLVSILRNRGYGDRELFIFTGGSYLQSRYNRT